MTYPPNPSPAIVQILVVEDFAPFRTFITSLLQHKTHLRVLCQVADGLEAVESAQALAPDLILMDIGLPGISGINAAQQIRELGHKAKIVFVTQETDADVVRHAFSVGGSAYVIKSQAANDLLAAIEAVLQGRLFATRGLLTGHNSSNVDDLIRPR